MGSSGTTQSSNVDIPSYIEPALVGGANEAAQVMRGMEGLRNDPSQIVAPFDPAQQAAFSGMEGMIGTGYNPNVDLARGTLTDIAGGGMQNAPVDINPYFNQAFDAASDAATRRYQETIAPTIAGAASASGRFGSPAHERAVASAERELADSLTNLGGRMAFDIYGNERQRQLADAGLRAQVAGGIPGMEAARFGDLDRLAGVGGQRQALDQAQREAELTVPYSTISPAIGIVTPGLGTGEQTTRGGVGGMDRAMGYGLGLAQLGLGAYGMGMFGGGNPVGQTAGAGVPNYQQNMYRPAVYGGGMGLGFL